MGVFVQRFETLNNLNPGFMKDLFIYRATKRKVQREKYNFNSEVPKSNQVILGTRGLRIQGPIR